MCAIKIKFVSRKVNKVRWQPKSSSVFVTGSYNDDENRICVWKFPDVSYMKEEGENYEDSDDPKALCTVPHNGCVTGLKFVSEDLVVSSSSHGSIFLFRFANEDLHCAHSWNNVHTFKTGSASATGIAVKGQNVASVGEDGKLCVLSFNVKQKVQTLESPDLCSLTCVTFLRHQEVVAGNSLGYLRLWDLRIASEASSSLLTFSRDQKGVSSIVTHPTQSHILTSGHEDGTICIWDMRKENKPVSLLEGHTAAISEIMFHPTNPDFLYTCSWDGSVWQWDSSGLRKPISTFPNSLDTQDQAATKSNPWLNCEAYKHKLEVTSLFSQAWTCINSLDHSGSTLVWGTDTEELCILNDVGI